MKFRTMPRMLFVLSFLYLFSGIGAAFAVTENEASRGLKEALTRGAGNAVDVLGKQDGFLSNEQVKILLPENLRKAESLLRKMGGGKIADELVDTMNLAAETAVHEAKPILLQSIKQMSLKDGLAILQGPEDAATQYFRRTSALQISEKFKPIIERATAKVGLASYYDKFAGRASKLGLLAEKDANLNSYVAEKTLDGLFVMLAQEEKQIRKDPMASGSALIKKVFSGFLNKE